MEFQTKALILKVENFITIYIFLGSSKKENYQALLKVLILQCVEELPIFEYYYTVESK